MTSRLRLMILGGVGLACVAGVAALLARAPRWSESTDERSRSDATVPMRAPGQPPLAPTPVRAHRSDAATRTASLGGHILLEGGALPSDASITAQRLGAEDERRARPDSTGEFRLELEPGTWRLIARAKGFVPQGSEGVVVAAGDDLRGVDFHLRMGGALCGTVWTSKPPTVEAEADAGAWAGGSDQDLPPACNGKLPVRSEAAGPLFPAEVMVRVEGQGFLVRASTDRAGNFGLTGLPEGTYQVTAEGVDLDDIQTVSTGKAVALVLAPHLVHLRGVVRDDAGRTVGGASLFAIPVVPVTSTDHDPWGETGTWTSGGTLCGVYQRDDTTPELARSDAQGNFDVAVQRGYPYLLGARHSRGLGFLPGVDGPAVDLVLKLVPPLELVLETRRNRRPERAAVTVYAGYSSRNSFVSERHSSDEHGQLTVRTWRGLRTTVRPEDGVRVRPRAQLPEDVRLLFCSDGQGGTDWNPEDY